MTTAAKPTKAEQRARLWTQLNDRQRSYLLVIYRADQEVEDWARGAWARGGTAGPAAEWRWLEYGITTTRIYGANGHGLLQRRLDALKLRDQGTGSTFAVLREHGLIETRGDFTALGSVAVEIRLTKEGRAVARAGGADGASSARRRKPEQLGEGHWRMLVTVFTARAEGYSGSYSGAWDKLLERDLVERTSCATYRMTSGGHDHYELGWNTYVRMYPGVNAPLPDGTPFWPAEIDQHLALLDRTCRTLQESVTQAQREATEPLPARESPPGPDAPPELVRAAQLQHERIDAADRVRAAAAGQVPELESLRDRATARFLAVAAAVASAVAACQDPSAALTADVDGAVPGLPEVPVGLPAVDKDLAERRAVLLGHPKRRRKATAPAEPAPPGAQLSYARSLVGWLEGGYLGRLMLRRDDVACGIARRGETTG